MSRVMLATECSEPQVMKAKRHQKIIMSFTASFVVLKEHHTARQTRIMQRMPRMKSRTKAVLILPAAAVERKAEVASPLSPEKWKRSARTTLPRGFQASRRSRPSRHLPA